MYDTSTVSPDTNVLMVYARGDDENTYRTSSAYWSLLVQVPEAQKRRELYCALADEAALEPAKEYFEMGLPGMEGELAKYQAAKALLDACGYTAAEIGTDKLAGLPGVVRAKGASTLCEALGVGEPTLNDIVAELCKPGRDVRDSLPKPLLRSDVMGLDDLKPGMELTGTVRNVIDFGAFVDLGVHQDGLVHVSQISDKFIKHPREVLKVGDIVRVKVLNVDTAKKRIALTMKGVPQQN